MKPYCSVVPATFFFFLPIENNKVTVQVQLYQLYHFLMRNMRLFGKWWVFRPVEQIVRFLLMADHAAPADADSASFLMLHFSSALGGSILGDLLTGELTGKCHFCKPDLEKHEIAVALSVCFAWTPPELAFVCSQSLWLRAQALTGFKISWICEMCCP